MTAGAYYESDNATKSGQREGRGETKGSLARQTKDTDLYKVSNLRILMCLQWRGGGMVMRKKWYDHTVPCFSFHKDHPGCSVES